MQNQNPQYSSSSFRKTFQLDHSYAFIHQYQFQSKDSTREETYDDILQYRTLLRRKYQQLSHQLSQTKKNILNQHLQMEFDEIKILNHENIALRAKCKGIYQSKGKSGYANQTPRARKSIGIISQLGDKKEKQNKEESGRKSMKNKKASENQNIFPRMSELVPRSFIKNTQMTERKSYGNPQSSAISEPFPEYGEKNNSLRPSFMGNRGFKIEQRNIFLKMINTILIEEKAKEKQISNLVEEEKEQFDKGETDKLCLREIEEEALKTQQNIDSLVSIMSKYESEIRDMHLEINEAQQMMKELFSIKKEFLKIQAKCSQINKIKKEWRGRKCRLEELQHKMGEKHREYSIKPPNSVKLMLRIFGIQDQNIRDATKCKFEIKKLVKGKLEKPNQRKVKIKQLMFTGQEGRTKFQQLIHLYTARIAKIQSKIHNLKTQQIKKLKTPIDQ